MGKRIAELEAKNRALKVKGVGLPGYKPTAGQLAKAIQAQVASEMVQVHRDAAKFQKDVSSNF
jgi:hypothetical protein